MPIISTDSQQELTALSMGGTVKRMANVHSHDGPASGAGLRLNLGCGTNAVPGWLKVDKSVDPWLSRHRRIKRFLKTINVISSEQLETEWPASIRRVNLTRHFPWPAGSVAAIYCSHMLEHLTALKTHGFVSIERCGFQIGACPDLLELENRADSLFIEALKPQTTSR